MASDSEQRRRRCRARTPPPRVTRMALFDNNVAIVTGAGRGIGRSHALLLASEGAAVVVNDLGGTSGGEGADATPAQQVVDEIKAKGGQAIANYDSVRSWPGAE